MRIMKHNDEIIKSVQSFKHYNNVLSEIVSEDYKEIKGHGLEKPLFCGEFTAKIYIGQRIVGTYKFDCKHFRNFMQLDRLAPKLTKIK